MKSSKAAKKLALRRKAWELLPYDKKQAMKRPGSMSGRKS